MGKKKNYEIEREVKHTIPISVALATSSTRFCIIEFGKDETVETF